MYAQPMYPDYPQPQGSSVAPLLIGVGVVGLLAAGGYVAYTKLSATGAQPSQRQTQSPLQPQSQQQSQPQSGQTQSDAYDPFFTPPDPANQQSEPTPTATPTPTPAPTSTNQWPDKFAVALRSDESFVMDVPNNSSLPLTPLIIWKDSNGNNQRFTYDANTKNIKTNNNLVVTAGAPANKPGSSGDMISQDIPMGIPRQKWTYDQSTGEIKLEGSNLCLDLNKGTKSNGNNLLVWNCTGGDNQKWNLKK
jgi:Ricin-type beta-trefoil lectin domain